MFESEERDQQQAQSGKRHQRDAWRPDAATETDIWVRWEYTPDEWRLFDRVDWGSHRRNRLLALCAVPLLAIIASGLVSVLLHQFPPNPQASSNFIIWLLLNILFFFLLMGCLIFWLAVFLSPMQQARIRHKARQNGEPRVTIGVRNKEQNIWLGGQSYRLLDGFRALDKASLTYNPLVLHLRVKETYYNSSRSPQSFLDTIALLIPREHEGEAQTLLERFQDEADASKKRRQRLLDKVFRSEHPPEPDQ